MRAELRELRARVPIENAARAWSERRSLRLTLRHGDARGLGEAAPLPGYSIESTAEARRALEAFAWPEVPARSIAEVEAICASIAPPSARFAAQTALLSLAAELEGAPLWELLGEAREAVPLAATLWDTDGAARLEAARRAAGAVAYKVKVGLRPLADELRGLEALREAIGEAELRLDANRAVPPERLDAHLDAWARLSPAFVEEPSTLDAVTQATDPAVPIALDESLAEEPARAARIEHARVWVLKPSRLGLIGCLRLAARANGRRLVISHMLEGPIARAAAAHVALVVSGEAAGLGPHPALEPLGRGLRTDWIEPLRIRRPRRPGLGVEEAAG